MLAYLRPARFLWPLLLLACGESATPTAPDAVADVQLASDTAADLPSPADTTPACPGPPPTCKVSGQPADCGVAFWDVHGGKQPKAPTPRQLCTLLCQQDPTVTLSGQAILGDKTPCGHMTEIAGLDCAGCCHLPDVPAAAVPCNPPPLACKPTYTGSLPGAQLDLSSTPCQFSIAEAQGKFVLPYRIVVDASEKLTPPVNLGQCKTQRVFGGVGVFERLDGNDQTWCLCDTGPCFSGPANLPVETTPGTYDVEFKWDGRNFHGPSDTGEKPGPAFPPGDYLLRVQSSGAWHKADGQVEAYTAEAGLMVRLVP